MSELQVAIKGPLAWSGADFEDGEAYTLQLHDEDIEEINAALQSFKALSLDGDEVDQDNFSLPKLKARLAQCAEAIHDQRGFFVLRGLGGSKYSVEDSITIYLGIASYVADKRGLQDRKGNVLFRHMAEKGGYTYLSSVSTAFNELLSEAPWAAKALLAPDWPVQISGRGAKHYLAPALAIHDGRLMASMDPNRFGPHPSSGPTDVPPLTATQLSALERISKAAYRSELRLHLKTGDLLFFNNWALLHRRDSYTDSDETSRHMVRLWLRNSKLGWSVPNSMLPPWYAAYGDNVVRNRLYPLIPMPDYKVPKYSAGSAAFVIEDSDASEDEDILP
ncbi:uncharacterized protein TRIREDRAFT_69791 [Trichoderma reesei QM6a]|uniref:Predicted protein n=2 Tax=Hypocrea jecorina TaxID=51453 RepID=G0RVU0_HYPJQ|nr:uncharacterized protein TRIREDRAFT_69791 [Trichoderma reesei QM6a]EGR44728.1 predicted protein [Trichoderma reesei QM6a]ETR97561.1 Clavaminate synthase-like protein [Trichoderma reesei RUT C-30]